MRPQEVSGGEALMRSSEVYARLGVSRREFYRMIARGEFPFGEYITPACRRWPQSVVEAWVADRIRKTPGK